MTFAERLAAHPVGLLVFLRLPWYASVIPGRGSSAAGQNGKEVAFVLDLTRIAQVVVVNSEADVNSYLRAGWVIIASAGGRDDDGFAEILTMLGKTED